MKDMVPQFAIGKDESEDWLTCIRKVNAMSMNLSKICGKSGYWRSGDTQLPSSRNHFEIRNKKY